MRGLAAEAGLIDPEVEAVMEKLAKVDAHWSKLERVYGSAGAVVKA